jgi:hypothetical protein
MANVKLLDIADCSVKEMTHCAGLMTIISLTVTNGCQDFGP